MGVCVYIGVHPQGDRHFPPSFGSEVGEYVYFFKRLYIEASYPCVYSCQNFLVSLANSGIINIFRTESAFYCCSYIVAAYTVCSESPG